MTVISFPGPDTVPLPPAPMITPAGNMALLDLLETDFPEAAAVDAQSGMLILSPSDAEQLNAFFGIFGLKLPANPDAEQTQALWRTLRFHYGRIVRVVVAGLEPARFCPEFNTQELAFGRTVAQGETTWAARLARPLLAPKGFTAYFT